MTKLGTKKINLVRCRGGNLKHRALRLEHGSFSWGSEAISKKVRIVGVVYNASNNELVRTNTLVKNAIVQIDAAPFRQFYLTHYGIDITKHDEHHKAPVAGAPAAAAAKPAAKVSKSEKAAKHAAKVEAKEAAAAAVEGKTEAPADAPKAKDAEGKKSKSVLRKIAKHNKGRVLDPLIADQFKTGRLYAAISSRPGQSGRADGYILEGEELRFYMKKLQKKKGK
jgi:small subunit ribosomal protein S8e